MELRVQGLRWRIADFILEADFQVGDGQRCVLTGPSGSGKTSLLRWIAGLVPADSGQVFLGTRELTALPPEKREIGYVFQEQALFPALNTWENVAFGLQVRRVPRADREAQAREWLRRVGLASRADSPVSVLSGGERQRVALARAMIWRPQALLLDEPFSSLDAARAVELRALLVELHAQYPVPMVLVSHDEADVREIATSHRSVEISGAVRKVIGS